MDLPSLAVIQAAAKDSANFVGLGTEHIVYAIPQFPTLVLKLKQNKSADTFDYNPATSEPVQFDAGLDPRVNLGQVIATCGNGANVCLGKTGVPLFTKTCAGDCPRKFYTNNPDKLIECLERVTELPDAAFMHIANEFNYISICRKNVDFNPSNILIMPDKRLGVIDILPHSDEEKCPHEVNTSEALQNILCHEYVKLEQLGLTEEQDNQITKLRGMIAEKIRKGFALSKTHDAHESLATYWHANPMRVSGNLSFASLA